MARCASKASDISCQIYRDMVRGELDFVPYFRSATPEQELSRLPLGSRPAKRNPKGGGRVCVQFLGFSLGCKTA